MTTLPNLPVYIVYDATVVDEQVLRKELRDLFMSVQPQLNGHALLSFSVIRAGLLFPPVSHPQGVWQQLERPESFRIDLAGAFRMIAAELGRQAWRNPEVLVLLGTQPSEGWSKARLELDTLSALIYSAWFPRNTLRGGDRQKIEEMLQKLTPPREDGAHHKIVQASPDGETGAVAEIFRTLRQRIVQRRNGVATVHRPVAKGIATASVSLPSMQEGRAPDPSALVEDALVRPSAESGVPKRTEGTSAESPWLAARPPARWEKKEPPREMGDRYPETHTDDGTGVAGWYLVGASQRGRLHEHEGTFREDAFAIRCSGSWHLAAVADGAGSHKLSRVGSNKAVERAVDEMEKVLSSGPPTAEVAKSALQLALRAAWERLAEEAKSRGNDFKDLGTTLLLLAHHAERNLVAVAQIGDGLLAARLENEDVHLLGRPESGEYSGQTLFLTNHKLEDLESKVDVQEVVNPILFLSMTDGVADDFYPPRENLPKLIGPLSEVLAQDDPKAALLQLINYERPGSFDDRTLVVLCRPDRLVNEQEAHAPQQATASRLNGADDGCDAR